MKITAINGSPRGANSNTAVMIKSLLDGFASNGDSVFNILLSEKNINYCSGCYSCWSKTPGVCIHNDDMQNIIKEMQDTNIFIIGSPLYFNNISGTLKVFFDRLTVAGGDPHKNHKNIQSKITPSYIMVSNCGLPIRSQFDIVSLWINRVANMMQSKVIAEFYSTNGKVLTLPTEEQKQSRTNYLEYLTNCGKSISMNMKLDIEYSDSLKKNVLEF